jgi:hypothetical protein
MRPQARFGGFDALLIGFVKGETACGGPLGSLGRDQADDHSQERFRRPLVQPAGGR